MSRRSRFSWSHRLVRSAFGRALAAALTFQLALLTACVPNKKAPEAGIWEGCLLALLEIPGGVVNVAGGNLMIERTDLVIDTRIGSFSVGARYNSAAISWIWSFDLSYSANVFRDATGRVHDVVAVPLGGPIPGTPWVRTSESALQTRGGLVHRFAADGRLEAIHWRSAEYPRLETHRTAVAGSTVIDRIEQCTAPGICTAVISMGYDGQARVVSLLDRAGRTASFAYDASGQLIEAKDPLAVARSWPGVRYEYASSRLSAVTNSEGERIEYAYEESRLVEARQIGAGSPSWRLSHGAQSETTGLFFTRVWSPLDEETVYRFDASSHVTSIESIALSELWTIGWTGSHATLLVSPAGGVTQRVFADDEVTRVIEPSGNVVEVSYYAAGENRDAPTRKPILEQHDSLGPIEQRGYDALGRLTSVTNGAAESVTLGYGALGEVMSVTPPAGPAVTFSQYGEHGRPGARQVGSLPAELASYDAVGNLLSGFRSDTGLQTAWGGVISRSFDPNRNLETISIVGGNSFFPGTPEAVSITHRSDGRTLAIARPAGADTEFVYDAIGRLAERREKSEGVWRATLFGYDAAGRETSVQSPNGTGIFSAYDAGGRLTSRATQRNGVDEQLAFFSHVQGQLVGILDSKYGAWETISYDAAERRVDMQYPGGESLQVTYDLRSRVTGLKYVLPGGALLRELGFSYDGANRRAEIRDGATSRVVEVYAGGRLSRTDYGNGLSRTISYDDALGGWPSGMTMRDAGNAVVESTAIYGGITAQCAAWSLWAYTCAVAQTQTFGSISATSLEVYPLGPKEDAAMPASQSGKREIGSYFSYDALSNVMSVGGSAPFQYDAERTRLGSASRPEGSFTYTYDAAGFATSRNGVPITWTAAGRLASIGSDTQFEWDMLGRPVSRTVGGVQTRFLFGGAVEATASGTPVAMDLGSVRLDLLGSAHLYRHFDFRGNVKLVSDASGALVTHYEYSAYGMAAIHGSAADLQRFAQGLALGDLVLLGGRLYDPAAARFLAPDPVYQTLNQFAYTLGNPIWYWDPTGRSWQAAVGLSSGAAALVNTGILVATGFGLAAASGPVSAVVLVALFTSAGLDWGVSVGLWLGEQGKGQSPKSGDAGQDESGAASGGGGAGGGGGGGGGVGGSGGGTGTCALVELTERSWAGWPLAGLVSAQLLLAFLVQRRARRERSEGTGQPLGPHE